MTQQELATCIAEGWRIAELSGDAVALEYFRTLAASHPDVALLQLELASAWDRMGDELAAIPMYRRAIALGIAGDGLREAMLGLGSSLRIVGQAEEAVRVLREAVTRFPDDHALIPFLALAELDAGYPRSAIAGLLELLLEITGDAGIERYRRALTFYTGELRKEESNGAPSDGGR